MQGSLEVVEVTSAILESDAGRLSTIGRFVFDGLASFDLMATNVRPEALGVPAWANLPGLLNGGAALTLRNGHIALDDIRVTGTLGPQEVVAVGQLAGAGSSWRTGHS